MDFAWGLVVGILMGTVVGFTLFAMLRFAQRADDYAEMYRVMREREELDRVEVEE